MQKLLDPSQQELLQLMLIVLIKRSEVSISLTTEDKGHVTSKSTTLILLGLLN